jgi:hypothetical protein
MTCLRTEPSSMKFTTTCKMYQIYISIHPQIKSCNGNFPQLSIANRTYILMIFASNVELWFSNSSFLMGKWILSSLHITNQWNQGDYIMNNISHPFTMKRIKSLMNLNYEGSLFCNPYDDKKYCMIVNALTITFGFSSYFLWPYLQ